MFFFCEKTLWEVVWTRKDFFKELNGEGILRKERKPREQLEWSTRNDFEIISKLNSVIRGLVQYYAPIISYRFYYLSILEYSYNKTFISRFLIIF